MFFSFSERSIIYIVAVLQMYIIFIQLALFIRHAHTRKTKINSLSTGELVVPSRFGGGNLTS